MQERGKLPYFPSLRAHSVSHVASTENRELTFTKPGKCKVTNLDFSTLHKNTYVHPLALLKFGVKKVYTKSTSKKCRTPFPAVIDTSNPICDPDLKSHYGNALVVQENDHVVRDKCYLADDCVAGGQIVFEFLKKVNLKKIVVLDMDEAVTVTIKTAAGATKVFHPDRPGNGKHVELKLNVDGAVFMEVDFDGSGAVPLIVYDNCEPGGNGDPHFQTWTGHKFDYHGQCDLVLIDAPNFEGGKGLDLHIRTEQRSFFSFINGVAMKIGNDILEFSHQQVFLNGADQTGLAAENEMKFAGYPVQYSNKPLANGRDHNTYTVNIGPSERIQVNVYKQLMAVRVMDASHDNFIDAVGITGDYNSGLTLGRDGTTIIASPDLFGPEWQVNDQDPKLFATVQEPQYPAKCIAAPAADSKPRNLRHGISEKQAKEACAILGDDIEDCVFDIMATGDIEMVGAHI